MRYFNTSGSNILAQHYTLMRPQLVEKGLKRVQRDCYLTVCAPPQSGKTTYFHLLAERLKQEDYKVLYFNCRKFKKASLEDFLCEFHLAIYQSWGLSLEMSSIASLFSKIESVKADKFVLIIDEVDNLNPAFLEDLLLSIRVAFHFRDEHALKSVILGSVKNVLTLTAHMKGSFNIADDFDIPFLTNEESLELLEQHETETQQLFDPSVKTKIIDISASLVGLVSGFAAKLVENNPQKPVIDYADYLVVEDQYLKEAVDKNTFGIIRTAQKHRRFVNRLLFRGVSDRFQIYHQHIQDLFFKGIIYHDGDYHVTFRVPFYQKCLYRAFYPNTKDEQNRIEAHIDFSTCFTLKGVLEIPKLIGKYKNYVTHFGFSPFLEKVKKGQDIETTPIEESALIYSFDTFFNAFLSVVGGQSYMEARKNSGKTDVVFTIEGQKNLIEFSVYQNMRLFGEDKEQIADYAASMGLDVATSLVFVDSEVTIPYIVESVDVLKGVTVSTYLVRYNVKKDFKMASSV
jgi:hypothetical protein